MDPNSTTPTTGGTDVLPGFNPFEGSEPTSEPTPQTPATTAPTAPATPSAPSTPATAPAAPAASPSQKVASTPAAQPAAGQTPQQPSTQQVQLPNGQVVALTQDQFQQLLQRQQQQQQQTPQQIKEPTPEEIDAEYQVIRPNEQELASVFRGGPEGVAAYTKHLHGAARMGAVIATKHVLGQMAQLKNYFEQRIAPATAIAEKSQMETYTAAFYQRHPTFNQSHVPILKTAYDKLVAQGFKGSPEEAMDKIAEEATALIRVVNPQFGAVVAAAQTPGQQPGSAPAQQPPATDPQRQMTTLAAGSGAGAGAPGTSSGGQKSLAESIFG